MDCRNCGNELPVGATFCPLCGSRMIAASMLQVNAEGLLEPVEVVSTNTSKSTDLSNNDGNVKEVGGARDVDVIKSNATQPRLTSMKPVTAVPTPVISHETAVPASGIFSDVPQGAGVDVRNDPAFVGGRSANANGSFEIEKEARIKKKPETGLLKLWKALKGDKE